jgi:hypothetical protein
MPAIKKNKSKAQIRSLFGKPVRSRIDKNMPDFNNDPVVVEKCEKAAAFFDKHPGIIESLKQIREKNKK